MQFLVNIWNAQRNATTAKDVKFERERADKWERLACDVAAENAALRSQINQRGAGGKFTKKSPAE